MRIDLEFVELHTSLFFDGINYTNKLYADPKKNKHPLEIWYDTELKKTIVKRGDRYCLIESTASMVLADPGQLAEYLEKPSTSIKPSYSTITASTLDSGPVAAFKTAQVSTPHDKVQGGIVTKRRAKFQGEGTQGE